jgi:hypothetical protein
VPDLAVLRAFVAGQRFPLVLKQDDTFGGMGVRIVHDEVEAERAFHELSANQGLRGAAKEALRRLDPGCLARRERPVTVQHFVAGRPANRAVACDRGQVLAGLSVEVLQASSATGPATVVRVVDHDDMAEAARRIVARLQLSGLVGFDFVIEAATGRPWLLEMNVRPTQICHLAVDRDSDMIGALAARLGAPPAHRVPTVPERTIALYPQEIWRDPNSKHLASAFHDVPWHLPQFIEAYRQPVPFEAEDWMQRLQRHWRVLRQPGSLLPAKTKTAKPIPSERAPGEDDAGPHRRSHHWRWPLWPVDRRPSRGVARAVPHLRPADGELALDAARYAAEVRGLRLKPLRSRGGADLGQILP